MIEVLKQSAEDVSKAYDVLAFAHTERALELLAKTRTSLRQAISELEQRSIAELESQEPVAWNENVNEMPFNTFCKAVVDWYCYSTDGDEFLKGSDVEVIVVKYKSNEDEDEDEDEDDIVFIHKGNEQYEYTKCVVSKWKPLYTHPPQRTWVGLDDDEMLMIYGQHHEGKKYSLGRMVEAKLKQKNGFGEAAHGIKE